MKFIKSFNESLNTNQESLLLVAMKKALETNDENAFNVILSKGFPLEKYKELLVTYCREVLYDYNIIKILDVNTYNTLVAKTKELDITPDVKINNFEKISCLKNLNYLSCYENELTSLKGIENMENLYSLNVYLNELTSLEGLENLTKINEINCSHNKIESLETIKGLFDMQYLKCSDNEIDSLDVIYYFKKLEQFRGEDNPYNEVESYLKEIMGNFSSEEIASQLKMYYQSIPISIEINDSTPTYKENHPNKLRSKIVEVIKDYLSIQIDNGQLDPEFIESFINIKINDKDINPLK